MTLHRPTAARKNKHRYRNFIAAAVKLFDRMDNVGSMNLEAPILLRMKIENTAQYRAKVIGRRKANSGTAVRELWTHTFPGNWGMTEGWLLGQSRAERAAARSSHSVGSKRGRGDRQRELAETQGRR
jgi:hypothetical protein